MTLTFWFTVCKVIDGTNITDINSNEIIHFDEKISRIKRINTTRIHKEQYIIIPTRRRRKRRRRRRTTTTSTTTTFSKNDV